jgi:hypothetical protein
MAALMDVEERLESDVSYVRSDIADIKLDICALRDAVGRAKEDAASLRVEVHQNQAALRDEMHQRYAGPRQDVGTLRDEMHQRYVGLRHEIRRASLSNKIWMLLLIAAVLGVMAHGFKWL